MRAAHPLCIADGLWHFFCPSSAPKQRVQQVCITTFVPLIVQRTTLCCSIDCIMTAILQVVRVLEMQALSLHCVAGLSAKHAVGL